MGASRVGSGKWALGSGTTLRVALAGLVILTVSSSVEKLSDGRISVVPTLPVASRFAGDQPTYKATARQSTPASKESDQSLFNRATVSIVGIGADSALRKGQPRPTTRKTSRRQLSTDGGRHSLKNNR